MQGEDWLYRLTGLASDDFASVQQGIVLEAGNHLYSLANHRRLQAGYLSLPALASARTFLHSARLSACSI